MGKNLKKNEDMYVLTESLGCTPETSKTLKIKYTPIKLNKQINAFQKNHYLNKSLH